MYLLLVLSGIREHGGNVEHNLMPLKNCIDGRGSCRIICKGRQRSQQEYGPQVS